MTIFQKNDKKTIKLDLYLKNAIDTGILTTKNYSTSFSLGIRMFAKKYRIPVYAIYGFVRFADEIVDSFQTEYRKELFDEFEAQTWLSIKRRVSTNPILHAFQDVVNHYEIDLELITAFLKSMKYDLEKKTYSRGEYQDYIYGSAEVVGLMCLQIFYKNDKQNFQSLTPAARKLGEAFQKINFLRDISDDYNDKGRTYFPSLNLTTFSAADKASIEAETEQDFKEAYSGVMKLVKSARLGVLSAYWYYFALFRKICSVSPEQLKMKRIRISNTRKMLLLVRAYFINKFA